VITLSETFVDPPKYKVDICSPPCVESREGYVANGETRDDQEVLANDPFSVMKRFSVDGEAAQILNDKNVPFDYEILHNSNGTNPPFQSEYGNDHPK
jgi:hypothetical protein